MRSSLLANYIYIHIFTGIFTLISSIICTVPSKLKINSRADILKKNFFKMRCLNEEFMAIIFFF